MMEGYRYGEAAHTLRAIERRDYNMRSIGITGGVGAGKSQILSYLQEHTNCRILVADRMAHELEEPGERCYGQIVSLLGNGILKPDGRIDKTKMAAKIFADGKLLTQVNEIVHPAVKEAILKIIEKEQKAGIHDYLFLEAALLIEDGYKEIVDEMWYIHTDEKARRKRLKASRGYTDEKIDRIMRGQLPEEEFYRHCDVVIDNSGTLESACRQIDEKLGEGLCQKQSNFRDS